MATRRTKKAPNAPAVVAEGSKLTKVIATYEKYAPMLRALPGVVHVSYGCKISDGKIGTERKPRGKPMSVRYAIQIFVKCKPQRQMDSTETGYIPESLEGVPTDIIEQPPEPTTITAHTKIVGAMKLTLLPDNLEGTLGVVVGDFNNPKGFHVLTNSHVACGPDLIPMGKTLSIDDNGTPITLGAIKSGMVSGGNTDCAIAALPAGAEFQAGSIPAFGTVTSGPIGNNLTMKMFSRVRNIVSQGTIETMFCPPVSIKIGPNPNQTRMIDNLMKIRVIGNSSIPFGVDGDSGSIVVYKLGPLHIGFGLYVGADAAGNGYAHHLRTFINVNGHKVLDPRCVVAVLNIDF